jgi:hypothetical protein
MTNDYLVIHTPGAFGNFVAHLVDCHKKKKLLPSPFVGSGASHARIAETKAMDMVIPGLWQSYKEQSSDKNIIGCVWKQEYFTYILHAYYSRTNYGQYGECGLEYAEKDFYNFVMNHAAVDRVKQNIVDLKELFNVEITEKNTQVSRHVLRMFFWFTLFNQGKNIVTTTNQQIKDLNNITLLDIEDIIDYKKLKMFFYKQFTIDLDFKQLHEEFLKRNRSLQDYIQANAVIDAVKTSKCIEIENFSVVGEASVFYELEKYYFNIPFFNLVDFFKNTGDIIDYIKYYPDFMKQPNKLYHQYYKQFPNPYFKE